MPYIVTWSNGRSAVVESIVRKVDEARGREPGRGGEPSPMGTNIRCYLLDANGEPVHDSAPWPGRTPGDLGFERERLGEYLADAIEEGSKKLGLASAGAPLREPRLPEFAGESSPAGLRLLMTAVEDGSGSYPIPFVEAYALDPGAREALAYATSPRDIPAATFAAWFEELYPDAGRGVRGMFGERRIEGELRLAPALGKKADRRYAILSGAFSVYEGHDSQASFEGNLELALRYSADAADVESMRGVIEGRYRRPDNHTDQIHTGDLEVAIESTPK